MIRIPSPTVLEQRQRISKTEGRTAVANCGDEHCSELISIHPVLPGLLVRRLLHSASVIDGKPVSFIADRRCQSLVLGENELLWLALAPCFDVLRTENPYSVFIASDGLDRREFDPRLPKAPVQRLELGIPCVEDLLTCWLYPHLQLSVDLHVIHAVTIDICIADNGAVFDGVLQKAVSARVA